MKINHLYIKNFGGITDFSLDFEPDFQVIYGSNESGKTTIQQFIKVMFYGFGKSGHSIETNQRKKYTPWSGDQMGGTIVFTHQGIRYRLERIFADKKSQDIVVLYNDADGEKILLKNLNEPGNELFQISALEFENTAFIETPKLENDRLKNFEDKINRKIGLAEYDWSYDDIRTKLENAKKQLKSDRGDKGYINDLYAKKHEIEERLDQMTQRDQAISEINQIISDTESDLSELDDREKLLRLQSVQHQKLKIVSDYQKFHRLQAELKHQHTKDAEIKDSILKNEAVTVKELTEIAVQRQTVAYALSEYEIKDNLRRKRIAEQEQIVQDVDKKKATILKEKSRLQYLQKNTLKQPPQKVRRPKISLMSFFPLIILEVFFLLGGLLLRTKAPGLSAVLIVLAVLLPFIMVLLYFLLEKQQVANLKKQQAAIRNYEMRKLKIENDLEDLRWSLERIENRTNDFEEERAAIDREVETAYNNYEREKKKLKYLIQPFFTSLPDDDQLDIAIQTLREKTVDFVQTEERDKAIKEELEELIGEHSTVEFHQLYEDAQDWLSEHQHELKIFPENSLHYIETQLSGIIERRMFLREKLAESKVKLEHFQAGHDNTYDIEEELNELKSSIEKAEFNYHSLLISLHMLEHSKMTFEQNIRPKLNDKAGEYLAKMTNHQYSDLRIDQNYMIKIQENDETFKEQSYYSAGLNDQINLALRLALTELLQDNAGKIPLILDDPLIQIDEERSKYTIELLKEIGIKQKRQILLFTSQNSLSFLLDEMGIKLFSL